MSAGLAEEILSRAAEVEDPAGRKVPTLAEEAARAIAAAAVVPLREVHRQALAAGVWPLRYQRNRDAIPLESQRAHCAACVAVVGLGGLGGQAALTLARLGIGRLLLVDADRFDETNLNRQALSDTAALGRQKSERAAEAVAAANPAVEVAASAARLGAGNAVDLLRGAAVILDALDNAPDRLVLEQAARELGVPLVHAAVAGFEGRLMTIFPGDRGLRLLYPEGAPPPRGERSEAVLGVPAPAPAVLATLQAMEAVKLITGRGRPVRNAMLHLDLEAGTLERFALS
jgi:molybdopterin/thiamine biosynthesis adenylyltransferase